jgi:integrase
MASIDKRGNVWRARVRIHGFKDKTRSFDKRAEAQEWAGRIESQLLAGVDTVPDLDGQMTLGEALEKYAHEVSPKKKGAPQELRRIRAWQKRAVAPVKLSLLTPAHFNEFKVEREEVDEVADNTIRLDLMVVSALFKKAKTAWQMPYLNNPIAGVDLPSTSKWRDRRLSESEALRLEARLSAHSSYLFQLIVRFALNTAARRGEILRLKREDVNLKRRHVIFRDTKNGENRVVPLSKSAYEAVDQALKTHEDEYAFPMGESTLYRMWREVLKAAKITDFRFHDLRHEATSQLFERGLTTMEVQKITGHKTLSMLLRYTQMDAGHVVKRLDATEDADRPNSELAMTPLKKASSNGDGAPEPVPPNVIPFPRRA